MVSTDDLGSGGTAAMVRQSSNSSCGSLPRSDPVNAPYLRIMKSQVNFFMTRLLFMQEGQADSLGAQTLNATKKLHDSNSSSFNNSNSFSNNSASRLDNPHPLPPRDHTGLLGYFDEEPNDDADLLVYNDNARILPNSVAKSMPPIPFPPAAPESPRLVEGKKGMFYHTPTHQSASPNKSIATMDSMSSMPEALPFADLTVNTSGSEADDSDLESKKSRKSFQSSDADGGDSSSDLESKKSRRSWHLQGSSSHHSRTPGVPAEKRVFPKNQHRSKRMLMTGAGVSGRSLASASSLKGASLHSAGSADSDGMPY